MSIYIQDPEAFIASGSVPSNATIQVNTGAGVVTIPGPMTAQAFADWWEANRPTVSISPPPDEPEAEPKTEAEPGPDPLSGIARPDSGGEFSPPW